MTELDEMKPLSDIQRTRAQVYGDGDFAHVENMDEVRDAGDTLFTFLMIELGPDEGCDGPEEALRRLDMAIAQIQEVYCAIDASEP